MRLSFNCLAILVAVAINCQTIQQGFCQEPSVSIGENPGQVFIDGQWITPEQLAATNADNTVLNEYVSERKQAADSFDGQTRLAIWCDSRGLVEQRDAHLKRALVHNPESVAVRNQLKHLNVNGIWLTPEQISNEQKLVAEANQRFADWQLPVNEIASYLFSDSRKRQQIGLERLDGINDPRSVTALEVILTPVSEAMARKTLDVIDQFPEREATESLMRISIFSPWESAREHGLTLLSERNRYDYVPGLVNRLLTPFTVNRSVSTDASGNVFYQYALYQRDIDSDAIRQFDSLLLQNPLSDWDLRQGLVVDANRRSLRADAIVLQMNDNIETRNRAIQSILKTATGADPGDTPEDWWQWWYDENEVTLYERPVAYTRVENTEISVPYVRMPRMPVTSGIQSVGAQGECLVAGTPVWTERGPIAVDTLMVGDRVLCQDTDSQKLEYRIVLQPTVRPPTPTFLMSFGGETVQASGGHLFWVDQKGWTKMRDLEPGMSLSTADGRPVAIERMVSGETVPLYNLIVDRRSNYFVGANRILSHDSTILAQGEKSVEQSPKQ